MIDSLLESLFGLSHPSGPVLPAMAVFGLASLLLGYRLFRIYLFILGSIVGFMATGLIAGDANGGVALQVVGGVLSGILVIFCWYVGLFLLGVLVGFMALMMMGAPMAVCTVGGGVCGGLAVAVRKFMIILSTSLMGAEGIVVALGGVAGMDSRDSLVLTLAIMLLGVFFQYSVTGRDAPKSAEEDSPRRTSSPPPDSQSPREPS